MSVVINDPGSVANKDQLPSGYNRFPSSSPACSPIHAAEVAPLSDNPFSLLLSAELMDNNDSNVLDDTDDTV